MIEAAAGRTSDPTGIEWRTADVATWTADEPFDAVISRFGVMFFDDPVAAFANIRAACAPGAELAFACWRAGERDIFTAGFGPLAARMDIPLEIPQVGAPGPLGFGTSELIGDTLAEAGWTNMIVVGLDVTLDYSVDGSDGVEERLAMALSGVLGRTAQAALEPKLGPDGWAALLDEARDEVRTFIVDGRVQFAGHIWLVTAINP
jgi:SAM-dependent methyltransferase